MSGPSVRFSVDLDELSDVIGDLERATARVREQIASVDRRVAELHLSWSGRAATSQLAAHRRWLAGAQEMAEGLAAMHRAAVVAHGNYSSAATSNANMFAQTR